MIVKVILSFAAIVAAIYLAIAFVLMEINPVDWSEGWRFAFVVTVSCALFFVPSAIKFAIDYEEEFGDD